MIRFCRQPLAAFNPDGVKVQRAIISAVDAIVPSLLKPLELVGFLGLTYLGQAEHRLFNEWHG